MAERTRLEWFRERPAASRAIVPKDPVPILAWRERLALLDNVLSPFVKTILAAIARTSPAPGPGDQAFGVFENR